MPETVETGTYKPSDELEVIYWKAPDKDGDGDEVWEDRWDNNGNSLGRESVKDNNGDQVYHYSPPDGFVNRPSFDHQDCYVLADGRGRVQRDRDGNALGIKEGTALVLYPDGRSEVLADEYSRHIFAKAHSKVADDVDLVDDDQDDQGDQDENKAGQEAKLPQNNRQDQAAKKSAPVKATPSTVANGGNK